MNSPETKLEYIIRAKATLRADLQAKTWPEKIRAIARMNEFSRNAREAMQKTRSDNAGGPDSSCDQSQP